MADRSWVTPAGSVDFPVVNGRAVAVDPAVVARWMGELGLNVSGELRFDRIGLGQSNLTFRVSDEEGQSWVLRRPPLGVLLASAHDVAREARILMALDDTAVPTPEIHGLMHTDEGVPLLLMEWVDGLVIEDVPAAEQLAPSLRREIGLSLPRTLATIHAVDLESVGLVNLASHKPYAQRQLKRWSTQWECSKTRDLPALDELTARLMATAPTRQELALVHGDFHIRNVISSSQTGEVAAVLDWELATLGDPLADMGSLLAYWPEVGEDGPSAFTAATLPGFPSRRQLADAYLEHTGRDAALLQYWHSLGLWKLAIIAEGVMRRALDSPQNKARAGTPTVEAIDAILAQAWDVAKGAGL